MLEKLGKYLYGSDNWVIDQPECEFVKAIEANKIKQVEAMLNNEENPLRDKHVIQGLMRAVTCRHLSILVILLAHDRVRKCIAEHYNLETYSIETGDRGLLGNMYSSALSLARGTQSTHQSDQFDSLLTYAVREHAHAMPYGENRRRKSLRVTSMLLSTKLFNVNTRCRLSNITNQITHRSLRSLTRLDGRDDTWTEYEIETIVKSPLYMACEMGDILLVNLLLMEPNIKMVGSVYTKSFTKEMYGSGRTLYEKYETPLELVKRKGFYDIIDLLEKHQALSTNKINTPAVASPSLSSAAAAAAAAVTPAPNNSLSPPARRLSKTQSNQNLFFHQFSDCSLLINKILCNDRNITYLDFSGKNIAFATLIEMFEALQKNHTVTELNLSYVRLNLDAVAALSEMLKHNTTIKKLKMVASTGAPSIFSTNQFGGRGVVLFAEAIKSNTGLTEICLNHHREIYLKPLAEALENNQTLKEVELEGAAFSYTITFEKDHKIFCDALDRNERAALSKITIEDILFGD
jgi:hypothetical protein